MCVAEILYSLKKLRADCSKGTLAIIGAGTFVFQFAIQKYKD
jgi:hypothetical protein